MFEKEPRCNFQIQPVSFQTCDICQIYSSKLIFALEFYFDVILGVEEICLLFERKKSLALIA